MSGAKAVFLQIFLGLLALCGSGWSPAAQPREAFPVDQVRPGMAGYGLTCVKGREISTFNVEVIGVLQKVISGHDVVLVRVQDPVIEKTGVFSGMSGSPVYIDGKLLGALAYSFPFSKECIAGVTPFQDMKDIFSHASDAVRHAALPVLLRQPVSLSAADAGDVASRMAAAAAGQAPALFPSAAVEQFRPILTPLSVSGASPAAVKAFQPVFQGMGFLPVSGLASLSASPPIPPTQGRLVPGGGVSVCLIRGDLLMSAGGTVTEVDGDTVYGFGHPFTSAGGTLMPMHESETIGVMPSLNASFKFFTTGAPVGAVIQDRSLGVQGLIGKDPDTLPVALELTDSRGKVKVFRCEVVRDRSLSALLTLFALNSFMLAEERGVGHLTVEISASIEIRDRETVLLRNVVSLPSNAVAMAATYVALPLQYLMGQGFDDVFVRGVSVKARVREEVATARLENAWVSSRRVRPGGKVEIRVSSIRQDGSSDTRDLYVSIPADATPGPAFIYVGDGPGLVLLDQSLDPALSQAFDSRQLLHALNQLRQDGTVYAKVYRKGEGLFAKGRDFPALPPSATEIFSSARSQVSSTPIKFFSYFETSLGDLDFAFSGSRTFQITVEPR